MEAPEAHRRYLRMGAFPLDCPEEGFSAEELRILRSRGHWLRALATGLIEPVTEEQERFVRVHRGDLEPCSEHEKAWSKLLRARSQKPDVAPMPAAELAVSGPGGAGLGPSLSAPPDTAPAVPPGSSGQPPAAGLLPGEPVQSTETLDEQPGESSDQGTPSSTAPPGQGQQDPGDAPAPSEVGNTPSDALPAGASSGEELAGGEPGLPATPPPVLLAPDPEPRGQIRRSGESVELAFRTRYPLALANLRQRLLEKGLEARRCYQPDRRVWLLPGEMWEELARMFPSMELLAEEEENVPAATPRQGRGALLGRARSPEPSIMVSRGFVLHERPLDALPARAGRGGVRSTAETPPIPRKPEPLGKDPTAGPGSPAVGTPDASASPVRHVQPDGGLAPPRRPVRVARPILAGLVLGVLLIAGARLLLVPSVDPLREGSASGPGEQIGISEEEDDPARESGRDGSLARFRRGWPGSGTEADPAGRAPAPRSSQPSTAAPSSAPAPTGSVPAAPRTPVAAPPAPPARPGETASSSSPRAAKPSPAGRAQPPARAGPTEPPWDDSLVFEGLPVLATPGHPCGTIEVLPNEGFIVGYCHPRRNPAWVAYNLFGCQHEAPERPGSFLLDRRAPDVSPDDYRNSGYDRGHMAPNYAIATRYSRAAQRQTFLMTNIVPQRPALNRGLWARLEKRIANHYVEQFREVWVITGPVFDDHIERLPSGVEIPDAFFKIVLDEVEPSGRESYHLRALAFLVPQDVPKGQDPGRFLVSIDEVERATGLDFFPELEDGAEDALERGRATALWETSGGRSLCSGEVAPAPPLDREREESGAGADASVVYVTEHGIKYHRAGCRYLARSQIPLPLEQARLDHGPCSVCHPLN